MIFIILKNQSGMITGQAKGNRQDRNFKNMEFDPIP